MKILLSNFWYGLNSNGKYHTYLSKHIEKKKNEQESLTKLRNIILKEDPEIVCICEIMKDQLTNELIKELPYNVTSSTKYSKKAFIGKYIFWHSRYNAFLSKKKYKSEKFYLSSWIKRLVYKIEIKKDTFIYFWHFSLRKNIRKKQFFELSTLIDSNKSNIICGDLNIFGWVDELSELVRLSWLKIYSPWKTFPSHKPKHIFDMFLVSKNIDFDTYLLPEIFSDHLAIIGEIK